jgi:hypothetical protein
MGARKTVPPLHTGQSLPLLCKTRVLQVVTNGAIGRQPHLLELELLDSLLVGRDGRALDTDRVLLDRLGSIERDLVIGLVTVGQTEIIVFEVDVEVRVNELQVV